MDTCDAVTTSTLVLGHFEWSQIRFDSFPYKLKKSLHLDLVGFEDDSFNFEDEKQTVAKRRRDGMGCFIPSACTLRFQRSHTKITDYFSSVDGRDPTPPGMYRLCK